MTAPMPREELLAEEDKEIVETPLAEGIGILINLANGIKKHGNYSPESTLTFIEQALGCFRGVAQKPSIDPADLWERYLAETKNPSPQGAMAFAVEALSNQGASK